MNRRPNAIASDFVQVVSSSLLSSIHLHDGIKYCDVCTMFGRSELILEPGEQLRSRAGYLLLSSLITTFDASET